jgi:hypothetical protein
MNSGELKGRRISIIGNSGAGKSTLARALSARLNVAHVELDALNWRPNWRALSIEEPERWVQVVAEAIARDQWITDGNYSKGALPQILPRATDVIWLDYSRTLIMTRVIRRSFLRAIWRTELWPGTGNREDFRLWLQMHLAVTGAPLHAIRGGPCETIQPLTFELSLFERRATLKSRVRHRRRFDAAAFEATGVGA